MENNQMECGSVDILKVLQTYIGGAKKIMTKK
jgi:seryl-tRNA synthetase